MMTMSEKGMNMLKEFEGCRLTSYRDQGGVLTIGYGRTKGVKAGDTCTEDQAEKWLREDIYEAVTVVNGMVRVPLDSGQFDALVDFVFNLGAGNFIRSTLLKKVNAENFEGAAEEFGLWNHIGKVENAGLTRRRLAEERLFREGM